MCKRVVRQDELLERRTGLPDLERANRNLPAQGNGVIQCVSSKHLRGNAQPTANAPHLPPEDRLANQNGIIISDPIGDRSGNYPPDQISDPRQYADRYIGSKISPATRDRPRIYLTFK